MKVTWCRDLADVVNIARSQGWIFYHNYMEKHYCYVYAGTESELTCIAVEVKEPLKTKYVSIDEDGRLTSSDRPIMPACARVTEVIKDPSFESLLK
ncbi:MAG: hypothetical protein AVW06_03435 [Hadesarchaea archaeon DG-33-1]|nr:MAG: hypothetical protein AVW06_03435 [Hadesarchaea archaeon DG-33-1]